MKWRVTFTQDGRPPITIEAERYSIDDKGNAWFWDKDDKTPVATVNALSWATIAAVYVVDVKQSVDVTKHTGDIAKTVAKTIRSAQA